MLPRTTFTSIYLCSVIAASAAFAEPRADGEGIYLMGPGMPSVFTFDRASMSCSVSWGTMGAPGPGPFTEPTMGLDQANFGMIVFSLSVDEFENDGKRIRMSGTARSITTVNDAVAENGLYRFVVEAEDGGEPSMDRFSLTMHGSELMFDGHTFAPGTGLGVVSGDVVIRP